MAEDNAHCPLLFNTKPEDTKLSIDDILTNYVGEFGRAQLLHFTLVSLAWVLQALQIFAAIFADRTPSWTCTPSPCTSPSPSLCSMDSSLWSWTGSPSQSTVSQWGLICDNSYKVGLVQSVFFAGSLIGSGFFGSLSDSFLGRKGALALACCLDVVFGLLTAASPNYWTYLCLRGATGFSCGGTGLGSFVLATEPVGPSKRGIVSMSTFFFFSFGIMLLCAFAYFSPSWRHLYVFASLPGVLFCVIVLPFLRESPRWYLVRGRLDDALTVLKSMAKANGKALLPPGINLDTEEITYVQSGSPVRIANQSESMACNLSLISRDKLQASGTIIDVFRTPATRMRMIIMVFIWLGVSFVYYGISLNVANLGTNLYLSVLANAIAEVPGIAITATLLGKLGRRIMLVCAMLLTAACSICGTFISIESENTLTTSLSENIRLACGVAAIIGLAGAFNLLFIYTAELFPTVVRNAAMGLASQAAQVGAIVAPLVVVSGKVDQSIPFAVFSVVSVISGVLALLLPETLHKRMYETLQGMHKQDSTP